MYSAVHQAIKRYEGWHRPLVVKLLLLPALPVYGGYWVSLKIYLFLLERIIQTIDKPEQVNMNNFLNKLFMIIIKVHDMAGLTELDEELARFYEKFYYFGATLAPFFMLSTEFIFCFMIYFLIFPEVFRR
jgi:hypothetical protein